MLLQARQLSVRPCIKKTVCCTPTYPLLTHLPKTFLALPENKKNCWPHFHQKITIFSLCSNERRKKNMQNFFFPTYLPTQKYRLGVQQTNNFLRMALLVKVHVCALSIGQPLRRSKPARKSVNKLTDHTLNYPNIVDWAVKPLCSCWHSVVEETRVPTGNHQPWTGSHCRATCQCRKLNRGKQRFSRILFPIIKLNPVKQIRCVFVII